MPEEKQISFERSHNPSLLKRDNKTYKLQDSEGLKEIWVEVDEKEYKERIKKLAAKIIQNAPQLTLEMVVESALNDYAIADIELTEKQLEKAIKEKEKTDDKAPAVKPKKGCLYLAIGDHKVPRNRIYIRS